MDFDKLTQLLRALADEAVEYVLVGGVALGLQGLVRATEDVDLFIADSDDNVERLRRALRRVWHDDSIDEITRADLAGEYPVVRYGPPDGSLGVDIMTRLGMAVEYADLAWEEVTVEGIPVRVATPRALYDMKRATVRPIDQADAHALRRKYRLEED